MSVVRHIRSGVFLKSKLVLHTSIMKSNHFLLNMDYLYCQTVSVCLPKRKEKLPQLLTPQDISAVIYYCKTNKHRAMVALCYGCGLRVILATVSP
ncbi:putative Site-specific recombinase, phage integrase family (fragment) [Moritella yayanosii]|uniref:Putative Site-specific recombinase, phage integrase family n=1 Tax=Moritella yayanosii TaxID=69539 RepID=A0A330LJ79_9GAMM